MKHCLTAGALVAAAVVLSTAVAGDSLKSGLPVGGSPTPFHPLNVTGPFAGQKQCLVWAYGASPVAVVFARKIDDSLTSLVKKLDNASEEKKIKSFVVLMTDDENAETQLKKLADKTGIKKTVLTIDNPAGPSAYKINKNAEVTVLLYNKRKVQANYAFGKGQFNAKGVNAVVSGLPKISK